MRKDTDTARGMRDGTYKTEHMLAWILALGALVMAVLGALVSFDILDLRDAAVSTGGVTGTASDGNAIANFQDSLLLFLPAFMLSLLAWTMHDSEHHVRHYGAAMDTRLDRGQRAMYATEHGLAYFGLLAAMVLGVVGIVVGFDVLDNGYSWRDGATWQFLSIVSAGLTGTLHAAGHHQVLAEQMEIDILIDERVGTALERAAGGVRTMGATGRVVDRG